VHAVDGHLILSATDLAGFLACPQLTLLDRAAALGGPKPPKYDDPAAEVLQKRGLEHEANVLAALEAEGLNVVNIEQPSFELPRLEYWRRFHAATLDAMRSGADVIYQGALFDGTWAGRPDFLRKVDRPSALGAWSYEVIDAKLAREAKGGALLQILLYSELLAGVQGVQPEHAHLALGGPEPRMETFRVADFAAYFRSVKGRFLTYLRTAPADPPLAPEPVPHCDLCAWAPRCDKERRDADHLAFVAGITRGQRRALEPRGVRTLTALAELPKPVPKLEGVSAAALERVRDQARIQLEGRRRGEPLHELLEPIVPEQGLAALPEPSDGDLFFDLEGDPYALTLGIEYLFGFVDRDGNYTGWKALDREAEKEVFERFVDFVMERLERYPDMHIYHYAQYEPTALKRLMGRHATREDEVDRLLRGKVFVDLYRVVRQGLRASVESYSIKRLEPFYGFKRSVDLRSASSALASFEAWLELGRTGQHDDELLETIVRYNEDDCASTLALRNWLESLRDDVERRTGVPVPRPAPADPEPPEELAERRAAITALVARLTDGVPADAAERTPEQHARWLLAQMLEFHRREDKSTWWEYFSRLDLSPEELIEDGATLGGLEHVGVVDTVKRSEIHRYRFPPQDHGIREGMRPHDPATKAPAGEVWAVDDVRGFIDLKRGKRNEAPHPRALVPLEHVNADVLQDSLRRIAEAVVEHGFGDALPYRCAADLLLALPPRAGQAEGEELVRPGESTLDAALRLVTQLDRTVLPIQGPPGAGKTYTGARMILRALELGKRVGITATSHKVISNLLTEVCRAARAAGTAVTGIQKASGDQWCGRAEIAATDSNEKVRDALAAGDVRLAAGTAWLWSREDMAGSVDILFIDEAGQFSLANALAVAPAASSLVLLGDPRQLEQPQQGVHPPGADVSALDHLLGGAATVSPDRGLFLAQTWRLHPDVCAFTSEIFYAGRLRARDGLERQAVRGPEPFAGSGLRLVAVEHVGNQSESPEEVEVVVELVSRALDGGCTWVDANGVERPLRLEDILVVAPYNAQVAALAASLPDGARVGTVDRFQGQEAPVVIYSMTSSSAEDAPRGMRFLYSPNRLNVATSRARCLAIVVASPRVFVPDCRTPEQMRLANAFCRFQELASGW